MKKPGQVLSFVLLLIVALYSFTLPSVVRVSDGNFTIISSIASWRVVVLVVLLLVTGAYAYLARSGMKISRAVFLIHFLLSAPVVLMDLDPNLFFSFFISNAALFAQSTGGGGLQLLIVILFALSQLMFCIAFQSVVVNANLIRTGKTRALPKAFKTYLIISCGILMLMSMFSLFEGLVEKLHLPETQLFGMVLTFLFIYSFLHMFILFFIGIVILFQKRYKYSLLCIGSSLLFLFLFMGLSDWDRF